MLTRCKNETVALFCDSVDRALRFVLSRVFVKTSCRCSDRTH